MFPAIKVGHWSTVYTKVSQSIVSVHESNQAEGSKTIGSPPRFSPLIGIEEDNEDILCVQN